MADVLKEEEVATLRLTRNGAVLLEQHHAPTAVNWSYMSSDRVVLLTNMATYEQANLGDIGATNPGAHLFIRAERPISIGINTTPQNVTADFLLMSGSSITKLYFQNTNVTNTAWVEYTVTDEDA